MKTNGDRTGAIWAGLAFAASVALVAPAAASPDRVRFLEGKEAAAKLSPEQLAEEVKGYLGSGATEIATLVPAPPAIDSSGDKADIALLRQFMASAKAERWQRAVEDDATVYNRFEEAFGLPLDRAHLPRLVRLLNRVVEDTFTAATEAKKRFPRARPYQRLKLARVCGHASPPKPETAPTGGASYPSGHAAISWAVALVMMELVPSRVPELMNRVVEYGNSRIVCGVHFPSDVEAGRLVGAAVVDKLASVPEFRRDLLCARREYKGVGAGERSEDMAACY